MFLHRDGRLDLFPSMHDVCLCVLSIPTSALPRFLLVCSEHDATRLHRVGTAGAGVSIVMLAPGGSAVRVCRSFVKRNEACSCLCISRVSPDKSPPFSPPCVRRLFPPPRQISGRSTKWRRCRWCKRKGGVVWSFCSWSAEPPSGTKRFFAMARCPVLSLC